ncbi:hypothetical protein LCGC14_0439010 [marine sediment metagenome]|uniref:Uncharacterized protein n=1 Tax=marine sediment metagenome TaxID=412755 RepID=A0A0F9VV12_9ZZZZ
MKSLRDRYDINKKLCQVEIRKNIVLVELGKPLTLPLAVLNRNCDFKKSWDKIQVKLHGVPEDIKVKKRERDRKNYEKNKSKIQSYFKVYNQRPEVRAKRKEYKRIYYEKNKDKINLRNKEYNLKNRERMLILWRKWSKKYHIKNRERINSRKREYESRPEVKARRKNYGKKYYQRKKMEKGNETNR